MNKFKFLLLAGAFALASVGPGVAAGLLTNGLPPVGGSQYPTTLPLTGNETIPADTNLPSGLNPASEAVSLKQLSGNDRAGIGANDIYNSLIGGDFGTNLWQRGTTVGSITSTYLYTADRWFAWSGTSTTASVAQDTTAAELPAGFTMAAKVARTGSGVIQTCFAQEVPTSTAIRYAGSVAEFVFHAYSGAGFSAANGALQVYILTGTGTDEGAQKMAWGLNGGGGGSSGWTGMTNALNTAAIGGANPTTDTVNIGTATAGRYVAVANIPATATELGVAICWKPVGASPSNDYVALAGLQLDANPTLSQYAGTLQSTTNIPASSFARRPAGIEAALQEFFYYQITESATSAVVEGTCVSSTTSISNCFVKFPEAMRVVPTMTYATGFLSSAQSASTSGFACTGLTTSATVTGFGPSSTGVLIDCASSAGGPAAGTSGFIWDAGTGSPTGAIKASAEL